MIFINKGLNHEHIQYRIIVEYSDPVIHLSCELIKPHSESILIVRYTANIEFTFAPNPYFTKPHNFHFILPQNYVNMVGLGNAIYHQSLLVHYQLYYE